MLATSCLSDQRYNFLKANHNFKWILFLKTVVVYQIKDTIFWKQITTLSSKYNFFKKLFIRSKIQFFESKSQPINRSVLVMFSCLSDQRYNFLKANHNRAGGFDNCQFVVYQIKDTIFWKQITTIIAFYIIFWQLFIRSKIQFFESKSQPKRWTRCLWDCCLSDQRYNFLKANQYTVITHPLSRLFLYLVIWNPLKP